MNGKSINFDDKNIKKGDFYNKNKKIFKFNIDDINVNKILLYKKEQHGKYNAFKYLGIMIMVLLDHYISFINYWLY